MKKDVVIAGIYIILILFVEMLWFWRNTSLSGLEGDGFDPSTAKIIHQINLNL